MKKYRNLLLIVLAFFAGSLVTQLIPVVLAHGGNTNLIHGCVRNNGLLAGFIRIVGANTNCNGNETALDWKQGLNDAPVIFTGIVNSDVGSRLVGKNFTNAYLENAQFQGIDLTNTNFTNASITQTNFTASTLPNANFSQSLAESAIFNAANLQNANFSNANLNGAHFAGSILTNTNFSNANLSQADFEGATNMNTATLTGVTWSNTTCPDGTNSDNNGNTCIGHLTP